MPKVALIIGTLSSGGAERVVSNLSLHFNKDIERDIILFGKHAKVDYPYNANLVFLDKLNGRTIVCKLLLFLHRLVAIKRYKNKNPKTTFISFLEYPNLLNLLSKSKHERTIVSVRNHMSSKHMSGFRSSFWNFTIGHLYPYAEIIVAVSHDIKSDLVRNYGIKEKKIQVIYNSYDIDSIKHQASCFLELNESQIFSSPVIITVGRLSKQKGQWNLLRSFALVKQVIHNAKLVILGDGELKSQLISVAGSLNLINDVYFLGFVENPYKYIAKSSVFVLTSLYEGFPNSLAEAMACGVPVISTDCHSGPREILAPNEVEKNRIDYHQSHDRYGILCPINSSQFLKNNEPNTKEDQELANSILHLLADPDEHDYFAKRSLTRIAEFDVNKIITIWEDLI